MNGELRQEPFAYVLIRTRRDAVPADVAESIKKIGYPSAEAVRGAYDIVVGVNYKDRKPDEVARTIQAIPGVESTTTCPVALP